jgi:hypothetical protein
MSPAAPEKQSNQKHRIRPRSRVERNHGDLTGLRRALADGARFANERFPGQTAMRRLPKKLGASQLNERLGATTRTGGSS